MKKQRIAVAMSGGVDSSVTAALLKNQGHEVIGISMQIGSHLPPSYLATDGPCSSMDHFHDARRVAAHLDIPFHGVNFEAEFRKLVIDDFVDEYFCGRTPNPCVRCNQLVKFQLLMDQAMSLGADLMATGHYARILSDETGEHRLLKGLDPRKDQSYFLFALSREQLSLARFPLGEMTKQQVRSLAAEYRLPVADKGESQEICFIADDDYVRFLETERGAGEPGNVIDRGGKVLGGHGGIYRYTVGQRKGLGIAHPHPLYVLGVDPLKNEVLVGAREELFSAGLLAMHMNWLISPPSAPVEAVCKIRYRHQPVACTIEPLPGGKAEIRFAEPEKSVTPGQAAVIYDGDTVLGGGWIERSLS